MSKLFLSLIILVAPVFVHGYIIEQTDATITGDFVIEPAKIELSLSAGEIAERTITVINRTDARKDYLISTEDIKGSNDLSMSVELLGGMQGPYSLKDYISPEVANFSLGSGEKINLPIRIKIPADAEPGGLYGTVLFSVSQQKDPSQEDKFGAKIISRLGSLFFVRVKGDAREGGRLERFNWEADKMLFFGQPKALEIVFRNDGNVHLNPYGLVEIKNLLGSTVEMIEILPYYSLPDSLRYRKVEASHPIFFGRYTASLALKRGYGDVVEEQKIVFWVLPVRLIGIVSIALVVFWFTVRSFRKWFGRNFERKRY